MSIVTTSSSIAMSTDIGSNHGSPSSSESIVVPSSTDSSLVSLSTLETTTLSTPSTSIESSDSPPLATDYVIFPDDPDWTSTYTYYEAVTLPTFTSTEVKMPTPTAEGFCMLDPLETPGAAFVSSPY
jgi:hypothetical protein